jgi:hypothetical protein
MALFCRQAKNTGAGVSNQKRAPVTEKYAKPKLPRKKKWPNHFFLIF